MTHISLTQRYAPTCCNCKAPAQIALQRIGMLPSLMFCRGCYAKVDFDEMEASK